jgi:hypothetical protein
MSESSVTNEAKDAQSKIAPRVKKSAFIPKVYGTKTLKNKSQEKSKKTIKTKCFFKKHPIHASIGKDWRLFHS